MYKDLLKILFSIRITYGERRKELRDITEELFYAFSSETATDEDRRIALVLLIGLETEVRFCNNKAFDSQLEQISSCIYQLMEELKMFS